MIASAPNALNLLIYKMVLIVSRSVQSLSNYATAMCNGATGKWECTNKVDVSDSATGEICLS